MKKNFTFKLDTELIDKMKSIIKSTKPKFSSQSHFIEVAIDNLIKEIKSDLKK